MTVYRRVTVAKDANGADAQLLVDSSGRQRYVQSGSSKASGTLNAVNQQLAVSLDGMSSFMLQAYGGTYTGATAVLEASMDSTNGTDGNWISLYAGALDADTVKTATPINNLTGPFNRAWQGQAPGMTWVRIRMTAFGTGAGIPLQLAANSSDITPNISIHPVTQSGTWSVTNTPGTPTIFSYVTAASINANLVSSASCKLFNIEISNLTAATIYVKIYNKATAPTVGTDVPVATIPVAAGAFVSYNFGAMGKILNTGFGLAVTAAAAATDTTAVAVGAQISGSRI